jgi:hypothetical protein
VIVHERLRGWWRSGWLSGRRPGAGSRVASTRDRTWYSGGRGDVLSPVRFNSVGDVVTVPGVALQWRGWTHRADSDGEDRSRRLDVTVVLCSHKKGIHPYSRVLPSPLRGLGALAVEK